MKKVFLQTQFGKPHEWTQQYIDNVQPLMNDGWYWKIFTPNKLESKGNVEIVPMDIKEFNTLVKKTCGVNPMVSIKKGLPSKPMTDYMVAGGLIFAQWLKDADFWGITNWDVVYGNLSKFFPDSVINQADIFSDDVSTINGVFSLYRNVPEVNELFKQLPDWRPGFKSPVIFGLDEYGMTRIANRVRFVTPSFYPLHSHDRLQPHYPEVSISIKNDGSLWELLKDMAPPNWIHARPFIGREVPYFHFQRTKSWPNIQS